MRRGSRGLWDPTPERDACGVGLVVDRRGSGGRALPLALTALARLAHRGAVDADGRTGDGAGVLTGIPRVLFAEDFARRGKDLPGPGLFATGFVFLPRSAAERGVCRDTIAAVLADRGLPLLGWRRPPLEVDALGEKARASRPAIEQIFVGRPVGLSGDEFEGRLFLARKEMERILERLAPERFCVVSLSHRTVTYKALVRGVDLASFYRDLADPRYETAFALFHQRYSTNTSPSWALAQPFRLLAHNGEINTIAGNRARMRAREAALAARREPSLTELLPLLERKTSDSGNLDNAAELLVRTGRSLAHAMTMLLPPAWENDATLPRQVRSFYESQAGILEPWDGPALVVFSDGRVAGAAMDRNGLRPARTVETRDGLFIVASEAGVAAVRERTILRRERLAPGDLVALDLSDGELFGPEEIRSSLARLSSRRRGGSSRRAAPAGPEPAERMPLSAADRIARCKAFGYTREEIRLVLTPMATEGREPLGSMGDDTPLAVLSSKPRLLFSYFKQRFAQVTNPPLDPLREGLVMSLEVRLGPETDLFSPAAEREDGIRLDSPVLSDLGLRALLAVQTAGSMETLDLTFPAAGGASGFRRALSKLARRAAAAVGRGARLLVVSDRGMEVGRAAIPVLLGVAAVHQELVRRGLRLSASLVAETGEARDDHQVATLLAFGAEAVNPYLALELVRSEIAKEQAGRDASLDEKRYLRTLEKGLAKILSKMGISTMRSYLGAGLFEAIGLSEEIVADFFPGAGSPIGGVGLEEIADEALARHAAACGGESQAVLEQGGFHGFRRDGEAHAFSPDVIRSLRAAAESRRPEDYEGYARLVEDRDPLVVRDLLEPFAPPGAAIPIEEVEPVESILPRFSTAAMSVGALSPEAHETLAVAMNRIGARSNSGEGGADPARFWRRLSGGDSANDRIKQVASGRFGVTAEYLVSAAELQIKMAQGSKPGEGGQLPGHKVTAHIAALRRCREGTTLISPPPHHDIYSIEDLAELIYDVKRVNPRARVGVKLVATAGIGTIANGVAKAFADSILVSGHDGGTGASPLGSIKNAGIPWEIGLAETQQALVASGLRRRVRLQVDGGFKTGRDVVVAALLGAEEYAFGSAVLVSAGCVMARQCHSNTCPAGIATQREDLRARYRGTPEKVIAFLTGVAQEVRRILARLGFRRLADAIGATDRLRARVPADRFKVSTIDLSRILTPPPRTGRPRRCLDDRNDPPSTGTDIDARALALLRARRGGGGPFSLDFPITNADRAVGARIAGTLSLPGASADLPRRLDLQFRGPAGQGFGAFCVERMSLALEGEANDHVGKGMSGGEIAIFPRPRLGLQPGAPILAGNAALYGATGGRLFIAGRAGERFAVRNSGATAVVEGVGDHGCEYMTAGRVAVLGPCGRNFGAGMSGGVAYALDDDGTLSARVNSEMVALHALGPDDARELRGMIEAHRKATGSERARKILEKWRTFGTRFRRVAPREATQVLAAPPPAGPRRRTATTAGRSEIATRPTL